MFLLEKCVNLNYLTKTSPFVSAGDQRIGSSRISRDNVKL